MNDQVTRVISDAELPDSMAGGAEGGSLLVDSAISHCEYRIVTRPTDACDEAGGMDQWGA